MKVSLMPKQYFPVSMVISSKKRYKGKTKRRVTMQNVIGYAGKRVER